MNGPANTPDKPKSAATTSRELVVNAATARGTPAPTKDSDITNEARRAGTGCHTQVREPTSDPAATAVSSRPEALARPCAAARPTDTTPRPPRPSCPRLLSTVAERSGLMVT